MTVKKKIEELACVTQVVVNLDDTKIGVDGDVGLQQIEGAIREVGYTPKEIDILKLCLFALRGSNAVQLQEYRDHLLKRKSSHC